MNPKLISCRVMIDELHALLPPGTATEVFEISQHAHPKKLQAQLQAAIDASDGLYDPIYLGYGMCAKAVVGLVSKQSRLVVFKADDCIELFLGSKQARLRELAREPGTYFLTRGYIGDGASMIFSDFERSVQKFGKEKAEKLLDLMMRHYKRLVYIRMPGPADVEADRAYAMNMAARFHMNYVELEGTIEWLARLTAGSARADLIQVEPGVPIQTNHFLDRPSRPPSQPHDCPH